MYDNCSMHRSTASTGGGNWRAQRKAPNVTMQSHDDMPTLADFEDDDDDAHSFARFQKESSSWLLFSGVLALLITLFITSFTANPLQQRDTSREIVLRLQQIQQQMPGQLHVLLDEMAQQGHNLRGVPGLAPEPETFATRVRDVWVPTLCYASLLVSLIGALVCLRIKHWLMNCTLRFFPLAPSNPDEPALRVAAQRFREFKKHRSVIVARTRRVVVVVPPLMYGAAAMFACGVAAKIGSFFWIALSR